MDKEDIKHLYEYLCMMKACTPTGEREVMLSARQLEYLCDAVEVAGEL